MNWDRETQTDRGAGRERRQENRKAEERQRQGKQRERWEEWGETEKQEGFLWGDSPRGIRVHHGGNLGQQAAGMVVGAGSQELRF